jgi:cell division protein FtsB
MASVISNAPTLNVDPKVRQNEQLRQQVSTLNKEIRKLEDHIKVLTKIVESNECLSCKRRKESNEVSEGEGKEPLGILSLPKINERIGNQNSFS